MEQSRFYIDVDQTLSPIMGQLPTYKNLLNLGDQLADDEIAKHIEAERTFAEGRVTRTFTKDTQNAYLLGRIPVELQRFMDARYQVLRDVELHQNYPLFPHLPQGLLELTEGNVEQIKYFTVRPHEVEEATRAWLSKNQFPHPENVTICDTPEDKLRKVLADRQGHHAVLVDDGAQALVEAAIMMADNDHSIKEQLKGLTLVGFGLSKEKGQQLQGSIRPDYGVHVITLPSWESTHVETLRQELSVRS